MEKETNILWDGCRTCHPLFLGIIDEDYTKRCKSCKSCKSKWNVSSRECKWNVNVAKMTVITFHLTLYSVYHVHLSILPLNSTFQFIKKTCTWKCRNSLIIQCMIEKAKGKVIVPFEPKIFSTFNFNESMSMGWFQNFFEIWYLHDK